MLDTAPLRDAYRALLDAAAVKAGSDDPSPIPPLADVELPTHTRQLPSLLLDGARPG